MFDRLTVVKKTCVKGIAKSAVLMSLTISAMLSGAAVANDTQAKATKAATKVASKAAAPQVAKDVAVTGEETSVLIENTDIVFAKVGPNEQLMSMDILTGYRNLHQNLRRRTINLSERNMSQRNVSNRPVSANAAKTEGELSK